MSFIRKEITTRNIFFALIFCFVALGILHYYLRPIFTNLKKSRVEEIIEMAASEFPIKMINGSIISQYTANHFIVTEMEFNPGVINLSEYYNFPELARERLALSFINSNIDNKKTNLLSEVLNENFGLKYVIGEIGSEKVTIDISSSYLKEKYKYIKGLTSSAKLKNSLETRLNYLRKELPYIPFDGVSLTNITIENKIVVVEIIIDESLIDFDHIKSTPDEGRASLYDNPYTQELLKLCNSIDATLCYRFSGDITFDSFEILM